jgi:hypothetical protein
MGEVMSIIGSFKNTIKHKQYRLGFTWIFLELLTWLVLALSLPFIILHSALEILALGIKLIMKAIFGNVIFCIEKWQGGYVREFRKRLKTKEKQ